MKIEHGPYKTSYGPGILISLDSAELDTAIRAYLVARGVETTGPATTRVNGQPCVSASVYVDPVGHVNFEGGTWYGDGHER